MQMLVFINSNLLLLSSLPHQYRLTEKNKLDKLDLNFLLLPKMTYSIHSIFCNFTFKQAD